MAAVRLRRLRDVTTGLANCRQCLEIFSLGGKYSRPGAPPWPFGSSLVPSTSVITHCEHDYVRSYSTSLQGAALFRGSDYNFKVHDIAIGRGTISQVARFHDERLRRQFRGAKSVQHAVCARCNTPLAPSVASIYPLSDSLLTCSNCGSTDSLLTVQHESTSSSELDKFARDASGDSIAPLSVAESVQLRETVQRISEWHTSRRRGQSDDMLQHWHQGAGSSLPPATLDAHAPAGSPYPSSNNLVRAHIGIGGSGGSSGSVGSRVAWGGSSLGKDLPTPREICQALDKYVIGQERAKKARIYFTSAYSFCYDKFQFGGCW